MKNEKYVVVKEGVFAGISYKINDAKFVEKKGKHLLELDYDVKDLPEGQEIEFENYLGEFVLRALQFAIDNDTKAGNGF